jgi:two-component system response regulator AtoC
MRPVEAVIRELAQSDVPVLVLAEIGAGKHATAQRIHQMSQRSAQPFRWLQCLSLKPEDLEVLRETESEGMTPRAGTIYTETINAGTIYLEELGDLSEDCQARLLEALPQSQGRRTAGRDRARVICGSARDLESDVKRGRFREDLYYRISGVCLHLPPLRQRKEDIPFLMGHFLRKYARNFDHPVPDLSAETLRLFLDYAWPGNLRELEDAARVLVALGDEQVALGGLRALLRKTEARGSVGISLKAASKAASREAEKELILNTLTRMRWNRRRAAEALQISYKALLYKLKQIGFEGHGAS